MVITKYNSKINTVLKYIWSKMKSMVFLVLKYKLNYKIVFIMNNLLYD